MVDIMDMLISVLCPTNDAASACRDFVSSHSDVLPPLGPMFYFVLFPMVFLILFIFILSSYILPGGGLKNGMKILIGVAVLIFIIINGWYPIFLFLSEVWFIVIILLFGFWYFVTKHRGGKDGGPKGAMENIPLIGGLAGYGKDKIKGGGKASIEKEIEDRIRSLRGALREIKAKNSTIDKGVIITNYWTIKQAAEDAIKRLERRVGYPACKAITDPYWNQINEITKHFEKEEEKHATTH